MKFPNWVHRGGDFPSYTQETHVCLLAWGRIIDVSLFVKRRGSSRVVSRATKEPLGLDPLADWDFSLFRNWCQWDLQT